MAAKIIFPLTPDMLEIRRVVGDAENLHAKVDGVKTKTDNLPADTATVLGSPTLSIAGDIATVDTVVDAIKLKTDNLPASPASTSDVTGAHSTTDGLITQVDTVVDAIKLKTDNLPASPASTSDITGAHSTTDGLITTVDSVVDAILEDTGTTLPGTLSSLQSSVDVIDGYHDVPAADATTNAVVRDVVGNKTDAAVTSVGTTNSLVAYEKGILTQANAIKTKTDNLPADTAAEFTAIKGTGFAPTDSLKDIKAAVLSIQNNTSFSAIVVPEMVIPASSNTDFHVLANLYDGAGSLEDPDLDKVLLKVENVSSTSRNANLFEDAARTTAATKVVLYTITAPSVAPTAGAVYHDSDSTSFTVIGMIGTTTLMASWTGATAPVVGTGTLTKDSGTGDATLTASAVDATFVAMERDNLGQFSLFYNVPSTDTEENLTFRFGYYEGAVWRAADRSTNVVEPENVASVASAVWEEATATHTTAGSFGVLVKDIAGSGFNSATDSLKVLSDNIDTIDTVVDAIKAKTDNLPASPASTSDVTSAHSTTDGLITTVDTVVDSILEDTGTTIPATLSTISGYVDTIETNIGTPVAIDSGDATLAGMLRKLFDDGSGFDATTDSLNAIRDALDAKPTYPTSFAGSKTTQSLAQAGAETLEFSTTEGITTNNCTLFQLKVTVTGATTSTTVQIYEKTGNPAGNLIYEVQGVTASGVNIALVPGIIFRNADDTVTNKVYVKITNVTDAGSSTFAVELRGLLNAN